MTTPDSYIFTSTLTGGVHRFAALYGGTDGWEAPLNAASPVVVVPGGSQEEDVVYVGTVNGRVARLSFHTGELLAEFPLAEPVTDKWVRSLAYADNVVFGILGGSILCACSANGVPQWQFDVDNDGSDNWIGGPVVSDGLVYVAGNGFVYAVDSKGLLAWQQLVPVANVKPVIMKGVLYTAAINGAFAFDAKDGTKLWETELVTGENIHWQGCAATSGRVFINGATSLYALDPVTGAQVWTAELGLDVTAPGVPDDGGVVLACARREDGKQYLHALDVSDGSIRWVSDVPVGGDEDLVARATPGRGPTNHVFVTSQDGHIYAFALSDGWFAWKAKINKTGTKVYPLEAAASEDPPSLVQVKPGCLLGLLKAPLRAFRVLLS